MIPPNLSQTALTAGTTVSHGNAEPGFRLLVTERNVIFDIVEVLPWIFEERIVAGLTRVLELFVRTCNQSIGHKIVAHTDQAGNILKLQDQWCAV